MFLLAVCIVSSLVIIESPRPTRAEGLLYSVTCRVTNLIVKVCRQAPAPGGGSTTPVSEPPSTPEPAATPVVTETTPPLEQTQPLSVDLPAVSNTTKSLSPQPQYHYPSSALMSIYPAQETAPDVLGVSATHTILETSSQGWRLLGIAWYWWLLAIGVVLGVVVAVRKRVTKPFLNIVK